MSATNQNRRKHTRAIFSIDDDITGIFSVPGGNNHSFTAHILNLSEGGIQITMNRKDQKKISEKEKIVLLQIKGPDPLRFLVNIDAQVKWMLSHEMLEHVGAGCEFINISQTSCEQIATFVNAWYNKDTEAEAE